MLSIVWGMSSRHHGSSEENSIGFGNISPARGVKQLFILERGSRLPSREQVQTGRVISEIRKALSARG